MRRFALGMLAVGLISVPAASVATAGNGGAPRVTTLSGFEENPPADLDGSGFASIRLNPGHGRVCWEISVSNLATPVAAHIHAAPAGVNGPIVVSLGTPTGGSSSGCTTGIDRALIQDIIKNPSQYYVNVHTTEFPGGAVRGQLSSPGQSDGA